MSKSRSQQTNVGKPPFDICERTFQFALRIVQVCEMLDRSPGVRWILSKQLLKAGTSVGANLEECKAARAELISSRNIRLPAKRPVKQSIGCAFLIGSRLADYSTLTPLIAECEEICKILTTIIKKCQNPPDQS